MGAWILEILVHNKRYEVLDSLGKPENLRVVREVLRKKQIQVALADNSKGECVRVPADGAQSLDAILASWGAVHALQNGTILGSEGPVGKISTIDGELLNPKITEAAGEDATQPPSSGRIAAH